MQQIEKMRHGETTILEEVGEVGQIWRDSGERRKRTEKERSSGEWQRVEHSLMVAVIPSLRGRRAKLRRGRESGPFGRDDRVEKVKGNPRGPIPLSGIGHYERNWDE
jgi:hypothetical protein